MRFIQVTMQIFAAASRLVALPTAKPLPNQKEGGITIPLTRYSSSLNSNLNKSIDIRDAVSSHGILVEEKIRSALDNYEINTGTMHPFAVKRSESGLRTRVANVPLTTYLNEIWMGEISIGTPPKTLNVRLDTGAADMWVLETGCRGINIPADRNLWNPRLSDSAVDEGKSFQLTYGDGSIIQGARYSDNVTIGGFTADPQIFGSVTMFTSQLEIVGFEYPADGSLGLAFRSISKFDVDPFFQSLVRQNTPINPIFSLKLSSPGAEIYVGGVNNMLYNGNIAYTPVTHPGLWQVSMDNVRVNGHQILVNVPAILDTGANYIYGDWDQVSELYEPIGGKVEAYEGYGFFYLPCDSFPTMSFTFGGKTFEILPEVLKLRPVTQGSPNCFSAVVARPASSYALWSIGITFLQGVYIVFDYDALRVGFAELS